MDRYDRMENESRLNFLKDWAEKKKSKMKQMEAKLESLAFEGNNRNDLQHELSVVFSDWWEITDQIEKLEKNLR